MSRRSVKKTSVTPAASVMRRKRDRLVDRLPDLREVLRGTLVTRYRRCGRSSCHCARNGDPGHGPAYYLMVTLAPGSTTQIYVPKEHKEDVEKWIDNFNNARSTLEEISAVNRALLKQGKLYKRR